MIYSDFYLKDRIKIPTSVGLVFVLLMAFSFSRFFLFNGTNTKASGKTIKRLEVTNLSPYQANVFWQTDKKDEGWVSYGENEKANEHVVFDDRNVSDSKTLFYNHYATIRDLKANQQYYFVIKASDGLIYDSGNKPFSFRTPTLASTSQALKPANGKVLKTNQSPENNGIIILTVDGYFPLSVLTKSDGTWLISLNSFYSTSKSENKSLSDSQMARIEILNEDNQKCTLNETLSQLFVSNTVIIGGANNTCGSLQVKAPSASTVLSATSHIEIPQKKIDIIYPVEGSLIPGRTPIIKGVAVPKSKVYISIHSQKSYSAVVTTDADGKFDYLIPGDLELGNHQIIITSKDDKGKDVTVTRNFVIVANSGEGKVLGVASGEPTITLAPSATPLPTLAPTSTTISPTTPVTGNINYFPILGGFSFIIAGLGFLLVF